MLNKHRRDQRNTRFINRYLAIPYRNMVLKLANRFNPIPGGKHRCFNLNRFNQDLFAVEYQSPALVLTIAVGIVADMC